MNRLIPLAALVLALAGQAIAQTPRPEELLGRQIELSLQDTIGLALENNLSIEIARTGPAIANEQARQASAAFDPSLTAGWTFSDTEDPSASAVEAFFSGAGGAAIIPKTTVEGQAWNYSAGFAGLLPYGLSYSSSYSLLRTESSSGFFTLFPQWASDWESRLVLPLLRDFIDSPADIGVRRSRVAQNLSRDEFYTALRAEVVRIEQAYWELAAGRDGLRVAEKSVEAATKLREQTEVQYDVGVVARVALTQAISGLAQREVQEIVARNRAEAAQDDLLSLVVAPSAAGYPGTDLQPESPTRIDYQVNPEAVVARALETSPELESARRLLEDAELALELASNQRLPQLDVIASYRAQGISGNAKRDPTSGAGRTFAGGEGSSNANSDLFNEGGDPSWSIGAQFEIPLANLAARSEVVQRRVEVRRAKANVRRTEQSVIVEARRAARDLASALEGIEAEERGREAAAEALRAEEEKLRLGDSTPFQVLQFEEDLFEAENGLIVALQAYRNAITRLERAQGTLLESRGIVLLDEIDREARF